MKIVRVPPRHEVELGTAPKQLELETGKTYALAPHADLWMRGAKHARIKRFLRNGHGDLDMASIAPIVNGTEIRGTFRVPLHHFA